jgi:hypothetical protein
LDVSRVTFVGRCGDLSGRTLILVPVLYANISTRRLVEATLREMSMKKVYAIVVGLLFLAAPALAADVDGKWTGTVSTPMGDLPVQYEFKADGTTLTGTTLGFDGGSVPIKNGKVDGDKISFTVTFDFGGMSLDLSYSGVVTASEIKMTGDFMGMPFEFTVKKA